MDSQSLSTIEESQVEKPSSPAEVDQNVFDDGDKSINSGVLTAEELIKELLEKIIEEQEEEESSVHSVLITVEDLIENAFGEYSSKNVTVHFKTLQAVLLIIASQLQLLKRQIKIDLGNVTSEELANIKSAVSIAQVNVHTKRSPKKKKKLTPKKKCRLCDQKRLCLSCLGDVENEKRPEEKKFKKEKILVVDRSSSSSQDYGASMISVAEFNVLEEFVRLLEEISLDAEVEQISELTGKLKAVEKKLETMNKKGETLLEIQLLKKESARTSKPDAHLQEQSTDETKIDVEYVPVKHFKEKINGIRNDVMTIGQLWTKESSSANKVASEILQEIDKSMAEIPDPDENVLVDIESAVAAYVTKISSFDTVLSTKMSEFQEELYEMRHVLETNLETIAEGMSNPSGYDQVYAELYARCRNVKLEIRALDLAQQELQEFQGALVLDLQKLLRQLEAIDATKSTREEVEKALAGKASLTMLNGLTTREQFDSVRSYYEKNILSAYDKFNSKENAWQKTIDMFQRELDGKVENDDVDAVGEDIARHMVNLHDNAHKLKDIVGDLRLPVGKSRLDRNDKCFACSAPPSQSPQHADQSETADTISGKNTAKLQKEIKRNVKSEKNKALCFCHLPSAPTTSPIPSLLGEEIKTKNFDI